MSEPLHDRPITRTEAFRVLLPPKLACMLGGGSREVLRVILYFGLLKLAVQGGIITPETGDKISAVLTMGQAMDMQTRPGVVSTNQVQAVYWEGVRLKEGDKVFSPDHLDLVRTQWRQTGQIEGRKAGREETVRQIYGFLENHPATKSNGFLLDDFDAHFVQDLAP